MTPQQQSELKIQQAKVNIQDGVYDAPDVLDLAVSRMVADLEAVDNEDMR